MAANSEGLRIGFGRIIATDRPIRGTLEAPADAVSDIVVRWRPAMPPPSGDLPIWSGGRRSLSFTPPRIANYRCAPRSIVITPFAGVPDDDVEALLIATALPALLWLEGAFVLHAACVVPHGASGALAIAGASGSGKSRLAAAFLARGGTLVADDSIAFRRSGDRPMGTGLGGGYHQGAPDPTARAFHTLPKASTCPSAKVTAIVMLDDDIQRLSGVDAVAALLANRHRASVPWRCGLEAKALADAAWLARTVPIYKWDSKKADDLLYDTVQRGLLRDQDDL